MLIKIECSVYSRRKIETEGVCSAEHSHLSSQNNEPTYPLFFLLFSMRMCNFVQGSNKMFFPFRRFSNYPIFSLSWKYPDWPFSPILKPLLFSTFSLLMILYHQISFMITWIGYDLTPSFGSFCSFFRFYGFNDFSSPISEDFLNPSGTWSFMSMKNSKWKKWSLPISVHFIWQSFIAS